MVYSRCIESNNRTDKIFAASVIWRPAWTADSSVPTVAAPGDRQYAALAERQCQGKQTHLTVSLSRARGRMETGRFNSALLSVGAQSGDKQRFVIVIIQRLVLSDFRYYELY